MFTPKIIPEIKSNTTPPSIGNPGGGGGGIGGGVICPKENVVQRSTIKNINILVLFFTI